MQRFHYPIENEEDLHLNFLSKGYTEAQYQLIKPSSRTPSTVNTLIRLHPLLNPHYSHHQIFAMTQLSSGIFNLNALATHFDKLSVLGLNKEQMLSLAHHPFGSLKVSYLLEHAASLKTKFRLAQITPYLITLERVPPIQVFIENLTEMVIASAHLVNLNSSPEPLRVASPNSQKRSSPGLEEEPLSPNKALRLDPETETQLNILDLQFEELDKKVQQAFADASEEKQNSSTEKGLEVSFTTDNFLDRDESLVDRSTNRLANYLAFGFSKKESDYLFQKNNNQEIYDAIMEDHERLFKIFLPHEVAYLFTHSYPENVSPALTVLLDLPETLQAFNSSQLIRMISHPRNLEHISMLKHYGEDLLALGFSHRQLSYLMANSNFPGKVRTILSNKNLCPQLNEVMVALTTHKTDLDRLIEASILEYPEQKNQIKALAFALNPPALASHQMRLFQPLAPVPSTQNLVSGELKKLDAKVAGSPKA